MINHLNMNGIGLVPGECRINAFAEVPLVHMYSGASGSSSTAFHGDLGTSIISFGWRETEACSSSVVCPGYRARHKRARNESPSPDTSWLFPICTFSFHCEHLLRIFFNCTSYYLGEGNNAPHSVRETC